MDSVTSAVDEVDCCDIPNYLTIINYCQDYTASLEFCQFLVNFAGLTIVNFAGLTIFLGASRTQHNLCVKIYFALLGLGLT